MCNERAAAAGGRPPRPAWGESLLGVGKPQNLLVKIGPREVRFNPKGSPETTLFVRGRTSLRGAARSGAQVLAPRGGDGPAPEDGAVVAAADPVALQERTDVLRSDPPACWATS